MQKVMMNHTTKNKKRHSERVPRGHGSFWGHGSEKKWYGTDDCKADGSWNRTAEEMLQNFERSDNPMFRCSSALEKGELRCKRWVKTSIHLNVSTQNIQVLFQIVITVNQLSIHGAVAYIIEELPGGQKAPWKPAAPSQLEKQEILTQDPMKSDRENWYEQRFEKIVRRLEVIQTMFRPIFEIVRNWTNLPCSSVTK